MKNVGGKGGRFRPTIPDLETGALGRLSYAPSDVAMLQSFRIGPKSRVERLFPEPQSGVLATELPQVGTQKWCRWLI